jgi:hypothetical protein
MFYLRSTLVTVAKYVFKSPPLHKHKRWRQANRTMKTILITGLCLFILTCGRGQVSSDDNLGIEQMIFRSFIGYQKGDSVNEAFCLLGQGFFKTPRSKNIDSLIGDWIKKHSKAKVVKVSSFGPTMMDNQNSKMIYCLIIEGKDTLNNYLVRNGAVPGGTMERPGSKISGKDRKFLKEIKQSPSNITYYMDKKSYNRFVGQIISSEKFARNKKTGIWKKENPFE